MGDPVIQFQILSKAPDETATFYSTLFGWSVAASNPLGYREINTGSNHGIPGGIWPAPPQAPNFVQLFTAVDDVTTCVGRAQALGAKVLVPATKLPTGGELAVMQDPLGMPFGITTAHSSPDHRR